MSEGIINEAGMNEAGMNEAGMNDTVLARLRDWLDQTKLETESRRGTAQDPEEAARPVAVGPVAVGLVTVIEEFTALRQEVKLQTKSSRGLEEQTQALLASLQQALLAFQSVNAREEQAARAALKPLVMAFVELDEALERGRRQTERAVERLRGNEWSELIEQLEQLHASRAWWARRWNAAQHQRVLELVRAAGDRGSSEPLLNALVDGYRLVQRRLAQTLASLDLVRIPTAGRQVDPETMLVVEVVESPLDAATDQRVRDGIVVDELRGGYFWGDELLKCAEVRVARVRDSAAGTDGGEH
jgi:molecular chaperone GrpE